MLTTQINYEYNSMFDILYIKLENSNDSYGHEDDCGIVLNYDFKTKNLVRIDIWDFKFRIQNNEEISLPIFIDLHEIYKSLPN